jgi:PDZ domain
MNGDADHDGLRQALASIVALETRLGESLAALAAETGEYLEAPIFIGRLHALVTEQREALRDHLEALGETNVPPVASEMEEGTVAALRALAAAFAEAAFDYAVLHGFAHRFYQVATANLAEQHRTNYLRAAQAIHQALGDVVVQKLQDSGHECRCECPVCSPGICLCWHVHVEPEVTGVGVTSEGIVVRAPRAQSNAERAGLHHGEVILAADGQEVRSYEDMLARMAAHQPGESVTLRVRRRTGEPEEVLVTR